MRPLLLQWQLQQQGKEAEEEGQAPGRRLHFPYSPLQVADMCDAVLYQVVELTKGRHAALRALTVANGVQVPGL